jgi:Rrf2 family protein
MRLSRETDYALQGLVFLARQGDDAVVPLADIAATQNIPAAFLSKILQKLARHGLIRSYRGSRRGYSLGRAAGRITVGEILHATEGPDLFTHCAFGHHTCSGDQNPCVLHGVWRKAAALVQAEVERLSVADLAQPGDSAARSPLSRTDRHAERGPPWKPGLGEGPQEGGPDSGGTYLTGKRAERRELDMVFSG